MAAANARLVLGAVHLPAVGESEIGDAYCVVEHEDGILVALADGLGHGGRAKEAAVRAIAYVEKHAHLAPVAMIEGCHTVLRGTRGAAVTVARLNLGTNTAQVAGVGNVETRLVGADKVRRAITVNGIVGYQVRTVRMEEFPFVPGDLLVMHSDGISERFEIAPASRGNDVQQIASQIAHAHGKHIDDQTLLVLRLEP